MRTLILFLLLAFTFTSAQAAPEAGNFGAGIEVGTMNSITGKYFITDRQALDFGVGFESGPWTIVYADYLWHFPGLFGTGTQFGRQTSGYVGGGLGAAFWHDHENCGHWDCGTRDSGTALYLRGVFGAEWMPTHPPIGVFAEIGPSLTVTPFTEGALELGVGIRYYF